MHMEFEVYTRVILLSDAYFAQGIYRGAIGYIIEIYGDNEYEVEFSDPTGTTIAQIVVNRNDIKSAESDETHNQ